MKKAILKLGGEFSQEDIQRICTGFEELIGKPLEFTVQHDDSLVGGFTAFIDGRIYDGSIHGQINAIRRRLESAVREPQIRQRIDNAAPEEQVFPEISAFLSRRLKEEGRRLNQSEYGIVSRCTDDVVRIDGCAHSCYGELLSFAGGQYALALDLDETGVGAVLLEKDNWVTPGDVVRGTGRVADIGVGDELLGRVVDPIGRPLDGKPLHPEKYRNIECPAPAIMDRAPVDTPLETGLLAVDSMIPIGRGQRELIVGDRQTGKTTVALSAILNQTADDVICVYCAIGQKSSAIAGVVQTLKKAGVMDHCVVVASTADDGVAVQYLTPYAGCSIAESFMYDGRDVLIVYDDLSKHAMAYRSMSLLLRRPSGREAYPGDVFYLHSRLLERSARLSEENGGGSLTALPIVETMAGDISAYIPTNVISITDGQIYLESELFNAGVRPAVNVGLSVSRVGRSAQHGAMKQVSGSLRLELAQYRDTAVFAQFGADIDETTAKQLARGERLTELLKQRQDELLTLSQQTAVLLAYREDCFSAVPVADVVSCRRELLGYLAQEHAPLMHAIDGSGELSATAAEELSAAVREFFGVKYHA